MLFFKRVAELEHISKAADELFLSQSHLSHVIIELETELGVQLFDRKGRGLTLNPCGREFYRDVVGLLNEFDDSKKKIQEIYRRQTTQLTLATNVSTYMPKLLKAMKIALPLLSIRQYSVKRRKIIRMLMDGAADFGICCPLITEEPELESYLLHKEQGIIVYPPGHWLSERETVSFTELKNEKFISVDSGFGTRDAQEDYCRKAGLVVDHAVVTSETSSVFDFVSEGIGIAIAPKSVTYMHPHFRNNYVEIDECPFGTIGLTWRKDHYLSQAGKEFMETTNEFYKKLSEL